MSQLNDKARIFLLHIEDEFNNLETFTKNVSFEAYKDTTLLQYGIHKSLENIGEACRHICKHDLDAKRKFPNFDFKGLVGFKNKLNHDYFAIDHEEVWGTLENDIPYIKQEFYRSFQPDLAVLANENLRVDLSETSSAPATPSAVTKIESPDIETSNNFIDDVLGERKAPPKDEPTLG